MSWQDDVMIEQEQADALEYMGEAEWRDMYGNLTVEQVKELNNAAKWYCEHEITSESEE